MTPEATSRVPVVAHRPAATPKLRDEIALCMEGLAERDSYSRLAGWGENARGRREYDRRRGIVRSAGPVQHEPGVNRRRRANRDL
jgi:hypothetical protein